ncbi:serine hydrolase domain-containing protein [Engelhardtia mirabilis]|uniref:Penicillin-binding protein PbpX n=1 Tax=Engelhardtia mirabilis TaxID=2528011 RepID=A0A518BHG5_9BACT|nr:Putative penicillin-binding protein PbpX [Planctomycetes bacterium Pla133]QDV00699.1 Putative penicillin-binding protein PbpX [Planctomycetes bacterium Pla86]
MGTVAHLTSLALALTVVVGGSAQEQTTAQSPVPVPAATPDRGPLADEVEAIRAAHDLPALGCALVRADGTIELAGVAGTTEYGGTTPVTLASPWHLGSCLKAMTATLAARYVESGNLAWTSSPAQVFAQRFETIDPSWSKVTLEQLLSHRAGVVANIPGRALAVSLQMDTGAPADARARLVEQILSEPTEMPPGSGYLYSNIGYTLAGAMIEAVGGAPFETLIQRELFAPLGIEGAGFGPPVGDDAPRGHRPGSKALVAMPPSALADNPAAIAPAGTAHMPMADWARFLGLHLRRGAGEGDPLTAASFESLHRVRGDDYALGWLKLRRNWSKGPVLNHAGSNTYWYCVVWAAPEEGFAAIVTTNVAGDAAGKACDELASLLIGRAVAGEGGR